MNGKGIRANIDTESVKGLLTINGGGATALLLFLPTVWDKPGCDDLVRAIFWGLIFFLVGLAAALIHNHLRRRCSLAYENFERRVSFLGMIEPIVCHLSWAFMIVSCVCFIFGGLSVVRGGFKTLDAKTSISKAAHAQMPIKVNGAKNLSGIGNLSPLKINSDPNSNQNSSVQPGDKVSK